MAGIMVTTTVMIIFIMIRRGLYVCEMLLLHKPCMSVYTKALIAAIFATQSHL